VFILNYKLTAFNNLKNKNLVYLFFLIVLSFFTKFYLAPLEYHWDENVFVYYAKWFSINGPLSIPPNHDGHVPFYFWTLASFYKILGESPIVSHAVTFLFSSLSAYFTYLIGKEIFNEKIGILASILLFFSPVFFAISGQSLIDTAFVTFVMMTIYFSELKKNKLFYLMSATLMVLTKEPGIIIIGGIILYKILKKDKISEILLYSLPITAVIIWYYWEFLNTGYFGFPARGEKGLKLTFFSDNFGRITSPSMFLTKLVALIYQLTFWNYTWILSIVILLFFYKTKKYNFGSKKTYVLVIVSLVFIIFFSTIDIFLPRYLLPIYPIFFIFAAKSLNHFKKEWVALLVIILFITCYRYNWGIKGIIQDPVFHSTFFYPKIITAVYNGELSLDYMDVVNLEKSAMTFIFENYPNSKIIAVFPFATWRSLGYVDIGYRQWAKNNITIIYNNSISNMDLSNVDLIVYESSCRCWEKNDEEFLMKMKLVKKFEVNNRFISIFKP
jgi:hypothetical protein